jgi:hypothetical protein
MRNDVMSGDVRPKRNRRKWILLYLKSVREREREKEKEREKEEGEEEEGEVDGYLVFRAEGRAASMAS